jgi:hypothetical protein
MTYAKPEIAMIGTATTVIHGGKISGSPDHEVIPDQFESVAAYQADE